jgi:spore germination protein YaaH
MCVPVHKLLKRGATIMAVISVCALAPQRASAQAPPRSHVSGNLVFWDQERGFRAIVANADVFTEVSPFWYRVTADGSVRPYTRPDGTDYVDPIILGFLRSHGIQIIPTVANIEQGVWNGALVSRLIGDARVRQRHVQALVSLAITSGYDGIDIDYEDLAAADRDSFSAFVGSLSQALHAVGKRLTVNVYGKTSDAGTWDGPASQDWRALGAAADEVRLMTYEYHWATSEPGPVAPIDWVRDVLSYARRLLDPGKVVHGLPFYGYDWTGHAGVPLVWEQVSRLLSDVGARTTWDAASAAPWFQYEARGERHVVWFENGASLRAKLEAADQAGVGGVMLWRLAGEDPGVWAELRARSSRSAGNISRIPGSKSSPRPRF